MGCSNGTQMPKSTVLDSRLPFSPHEVEEIKAIWDLVKRKFEETSRENLIRLFSHYPYFQDLFPQLRHLQGEQEMRSCPQFDIHAMSIFAMYDEVIQNMDIDLDMVVSKLEDVARMHARIDGFHADFFQYMEEPFLESLKEKLWGQYNDEDEVLMKRFFTWIQEFLTSEVTAIEYKLIPGD